MSQAQRCNVSNGRIRTGAAAVDELSQQTGMSQAAIMAYVRYIGGAMIGISITVVVLTELLTLDAMDVSSGPFAGIIDTLESTGAAALGLLVIGLLVAAASGVMRWFGVGF